MIGVYFVVSMVIVAICCAALIGHGVNEKSTGEAVLGFLLIIGMLVLLFFSASEYHEPKAMDVYQGKQP